jgi:transposase-like protein
MYKLKPKGTRLYRPLSKEEKKEICKKMRSPGTTQIQLALEHGVHPSAIARACAWGGIGRWASLTPKREEKAVKLLRDGKSVARVAKATRLQDRIIKQLMEKHAIIHKVGGGPKLSAKKRAEIAEAIRNREDHMYRLAKKFKVARATIRRIAREITGVERFVGWVGIEPLTPVTSDVQLKNGYETFLEKLVHEKFPKEQNMQNQDIDATYRKIVETFAAAWYDGHIPANRNAFVIELLESYLPKTKPDFIKMLNAEEYARERAVVAAYIRKAVECVAGSTWTN